MKESGFIGTQAVPSNYLLHYSGPMEITPTELQKQIPSDILEPYRIPVRDMLTQWILHLSSTADAMNSIVQRAKEAIMTNSKEMDSAVRNNHGANAAKIAGAVLVSAFTPLDISAKRTSTEDVKASYLARERGLTNDKRVAEDLCGILAALRACCQRMLDALNQGNDSLLVRILCVPWNNQRNRNLDAPLVLSLLPENNIWNLQPMLNDAANPRFKELSSIGDNLKVNLRIPAAVTELLNPVIPGTIILEQTLNDAATLQALDAAWNGVEDPLPDWAEPTLKEIYLRRFGTLAQVQYQQAAQAAAAGNALAASRIFDRIRGWKDSAIQADTLLEKHNQASYDEAVAAMKEGHFDVAAYILQELGDYRDSAALAQQALETDLQQKYDHAARLMADGLYDDAIRRFKALGSFRDSSEQCVLAQQAQENARLEIRYQEAAAMMQAKRYDDAALCFNRIASYKDSTDQAARCRAMVKKKKLIRAAVIGGGVAAAAALIILLT